MTHIMYAKVVALSLGAGVGKKSSSIKHEGKQCRTVSIIMQSDNSVQSVLTFMFAWLLI